MKRSPSLFSSKRTLAQILSLLGPGGMALALAFAIGCAKSAKTPTPIFARTGAMAGSAPSYAASPRASLADRFALNREELWVIARQDTSVESEISDGPGTGVLMVKNEDSQVPLPLKHTNVRADIHGFIGSVEVVQQFFNPYSGKIEAVYVFPLPHDAAVNEFIMKIGERRIRGIIRERHEAEQIYQEAKHQGYVASLLTEERPNIFTQSVANIEPGKQIDVTIRYFHTLSYVDGWYEFVFPMVVGPRFNPPGSTSGIGAVPRGTVGGSGQPTEVPYLKPGERSGHDIALRVAVNGGVPIEEYECRTHQLVQEQSSNDRLVLSLDPSDRIPNRDLVLRYRVAGERIKAGLLTQHDRRGGYFALMLHPPKDLEALVRHPVELVFVLDCSGSMSGRPLAEAKAAIDSALGKLQPGDSFQLINFSTRASQLGSSPLEATPRNIQRARRHLRQLNSEGGTMMIEGIKAALDFPHDPERLRFVCFLTDGFIGNEAEILGEIQRRLGDSRIFSFGIGSSVNRYLMEHMAKLGRGAVAYLGSRDSATEIMDAFFERISHPALTDIRIDWGGMRVQDVFPRRIPDLFAGQPVVLTGRFSGKGPGSIRVTGNVAGQGVHLRVPIEDETLDHAASALPQVWARNKIADLGDESTLALRPDLARQILSVAVEYGLVSPFTAFVAVDASQRTEGSQGTTVGVAVPVPEGVRYDTAVE